MACIVVACSTLCCNQRLSMLGIHSDSEETVGPTGAAAPNQSDPYALIMQAAKTET